MKTIGVYSNTSEELTFLGRGAAFLPSEGNTSAYIKNKGVLYLFDCGETVFSKIIEKNVLDGIHTVHIFITHLHSDHVGSLGSLLNYLYYIMSIKATVYCYNTDIKHLLLSAGLVIGQHVNFKDLSLETSYEYILIDDEFSIMYNRVMHADIKATSFTFYYKSVERYYTGDIGKSNFEWINYLLLNGARSIYIDTSLNGVPGVHLSIHEIAKAIAPEFRENIWCMHIDSLEVLEVAKKYGFNVVEVK